MSSMTKIFAANWKLHKTPAESREFCTKLQAVKTTGEIMIFPPATSWEAFAAQKAFAWGAQNIWHEVKGAFTGENSAAVLKSLGGTLALVGHSERRQLFGETDELLAKKIKTLQSLAITPVLCIGETLDEREKNLTEKVLRHQLQHSLAGVDSAPRVIVAYEPVWAIGTGKVASEAQVRDAHAFVRTTLNETGFKNSQILYGGSVKADNAKGLNAIPHVDGFLIGGASLEVDSFTQIMQNAN